MQGLRQLILILLVTGLPALVQSAENPALFAGQDLYLSANNLVSNPNTAAERCLVFNENFSLVIDGTSFTSDSAVIWLEVKPQGFKSQSSKIYNVKAYLTGKIVNKVEKNSLSIKLSRKETNGGNGLILNFDVSGEVFVTAQKRETKDVQQMPIYKKAQSAIAAQNIIPAANIQPAAAASAKPSVPEKAAKKDILQPDFLERFFAETKQPPRRPVQPIKYPVNIGWGQNPPRIESVPAGEGLNAATILGRFYIWQKQDEAGRILELQADNAVIFYTNPLVKEEPNSKPSVMNKGPIQSVYLSGDCILTDGLRIIRADEMYYDFADSNAIVINAVMKTFDEERNIPIYVKAAKLKEIAESKFTAEGVTITTSEFYKPQISVTASKAAITDTTNLDSQTGTENKNSFQAELQDVKFKLDDFTFFSWPTIRTNLVRPDTPLKSIRTGFDSRWGPSIETQWYFARLLGLNEPEGVDGTLSADYFGKRGPGGGAEIEYTKNTYYGRMLYYIIRDHGEDDLGRDPSRRDLEPGKDNRGRFSIQHRHFLPDKWQLTTELNYSSDENFIESFYRGEFNVYKQQTYVHLRQLNDNRALSILGSWRINNFQDYLQESPTLEYRRTADSIFSDRFSLYTDIEISNLQQRIGRNHNISIDDDPYTFLSYRNELDMPLRISSFKVTPYVAGNFGYDDRSGFQRSLVDGSDTGPFGEENVWIGEAGIRIFPQSLWKVYPNAKSQLWDVNQIRHIIQPSVTGTLFAESDNVVEQRDIVNFGLSQRLETRRGPFGREETVDWMRLDTEYVLMEDNASLSDAGPVPNRYLWAKPFVPLRVFSAPQIFNGDLENSLHRFEVWGPQRDYFATDYFWRISDTTSLMGGLFYDTRNTSIEQYNIGISRLVWPNLTYYIGSRYLRRTEILDQKGSNAFTFAATYVLDPRYTLVFAQQFDFDYGSNIRSDVTLIRNYHRVTCAFTLSVDDTLNRQAVLFSIWPQGVKEMAIGDKRYTDLGGAPGF